MSDIASIIQQLEEKRAAIDNALEALRGVSTESTGPKRGRPKGSQNGRQRQIEAMKAYWATKKSGSEKATKKAGKTRQLTAAGRKALSANMKRLWATKRAEAKKT